MQNKVTLFCKVTIKTTDRQQERRFFLHFFRFRKAVIFSKTERKVTGLPACNFLTNSMGIHYLCTRIPTKRPVVFRRGRRPEREHRGGAGESRSEPGSHREPPGAKPEAPTGRTGKQPEKGRRESRETTGANRRLKKTATDIGKHRKTSGRHPKTTEQLRTGVRHHERTKPHKKIRL